MTTHNTHNVADYFPRRANVRVPNMSYHSDVEGTGFTRMELGTPPAALATGIVSAQSIATALVKNTAGLVANHRNNMGRYGRNVTMVLSGAGTPAVIVYGLDYLGQPMSETFAGNGSTPVVGNKCFKEVTSISADAVSATTINVGYGDKLGLPFAVGVITNEYIDGVVPGNLGAKTVAVLTAQTATSGDPRGSYLPHASFVANGSRDYVLIGKVIEGDLHGLPHFTS